MLITKVKVGKVTNLSEARYCAGMGVDFLSFPINSVDPKTYQEITGWVAGPKFGIEVNAENLDAISQYQADFIQVPIELIEKISGDKSLAVTIDSVSADLQKLKSLKGRIEFLELTVNSLDPSSQSFIETCSKEFQVLIKPSSSLKMEDVLKLNITGISLDGGAEERPGLKEYPLAEILEKLEEA